MHRKSKCFEVWMNTRRTSIYIYWHGMTMLRLPSFTTFWCLKHVRWTDDLESWQLVLLHSSQSQALPRLWFLRILWKHAHDCWWATIRDRQSNTPKNPVSGRQLYSHQELCWHVTSWTLYDASCRRYFTLYLTIVVLEHGYEHLSHSSELYIAWVSLMGYMGILLPLP